MKNKKNYSLPGLFIVFLTIFGCSSAQEWPESPLYQFPESDPDWEQPQSLEEAMQSIVGHYAHYDVVSYEDTTTQATMLTFIISYGFTDFFIEDGKLYQRDQFCHAEQKINQKYTESSFSDAAVQAIQPRVQEVSLKFEEEEWHIHRIATPTLLGITGDPSLPLSQDPEDPLLIDPDKDGNPGVTVNLTIGGFLKGEIYITRREIFENHLVLNSDGNLYGVVVDNSEQFVIGASLKMLNQPSNSVQIQDEGMNPLMLIRIDESIDTCAELKENQALFFPQEPEFL